MLHGSSASTLEHSNVRDCGALSPSNQKEDSMDLTPATVVLFGAYLGFGVGALRIDFLLRLHLARSARARIAVVAWYFVASVAWWGVLAAEHRAEQQLLTQLLNDYRESSDR